MRMLAAQLGVVKEQILENDRMVRASARETELGRRLMETPVVNDDKQLLDPIPPDRRDDPELRQMRPLRVSISVCAGD